MASAQMFEFPPAEQLTPTLKCSHGLYIPVDEQRAGLETSSCCGICNPVLYSDPILLKGMARRVRPASRSYDFGERELDVAAFMEQAENKRIAAAQEFFG